MVRETARATCEAMRSARTEDASHVHLVQVRCPLLTAERIGDALARHQPVVTPDTYESMAYSCGASALGVAVALGEVAEDDVSDGAILHNWSLCSERLEGDVR